MRTLQSEAMKVVAAGIAGMILLAGCEKPAPPPERPAPAVPAPSAPAATTYAPATVQPDTAVVPPATTATLIVDAQPAIASMRMAVASSKMSVPVDLRYQFDGDVQTGKPVTLHLAAVPRAEGSNLQMSVKDTDGIVTSGSASGAQKALAGTAYRRQLSMTKLTSAPSELRVLVTMDLPEGSAFGWFGVPLDNTQVGLQGLPSRQN